MWGQLPLATMLSFSLSEFPQAIISNRVQDFLFVAN